MLVHSSVSVLFSLTAERSLAEIFWDACTKYTMLRLACIEKEGGDGEIGE